MKVEGVGKGPQPVTEHYTVPGCLEDGQSITYGTPVIPDSQVPALLGLRSMEALQTILDLRPGKWLMYMGDDITITAGPHQNPADAYGYEWSPYGSHD